MQLKCYPNQKPPITSEQYVRDLVYFTNGFHLPRDAVFANPTHYEPHQGDPNQSDTSVVVSMPQGRCGGDTGQKTLYYKRLFLSQLTQLTPGAIILPLASFSFSSILPQINALYGINLDVTDIIDRECSPGDDTFLLRANPNSLAWQTDIYLPIKFDVFALITVTNLFGFDPVPA